MNRRLNRLEARTRPAPGLDAAAWTPTMTLEEARKVLSRYTPQELAALEARLEEGDRGPE